MPFGEQEDASVQITIVASIAAAGLGLETSSVVRACDMLKKKVEGGVESRRRVGQREVSSRVGVGWESVCKRVGMVCVFSV